VDFHRIVTTLGIEIASADNCDYAPKSCSTSPRQKFTPRVRLLIAAAALVRTHPASLRWPIT